MNLELAAAVLVVGAVVLALMVLTASGQHRRGQGPVISLAAGFFFPITWTVWYVHDEHPYRTLRRT